MREVKFRCSSVGKLMTEPRSKSEGPLSVGAKTHIRELAAQDIFGVEFTFTSAETEKGILCEPDSIALLNSVRGLALSKNTERRDDGLITGECDLFDAHRRRGHDLKTSWSIKTFPIVAADCEDRLYEWQMRGYMRLWDADEWEVNYCLVNTPEHLIRFEPLALHLVDHIPPHHRLTTWLVRRDADKETAMAEKIRAAREYYAEVISEFDRAHPETLADVAALVLEPDDEQERERAAALRQSSEQLQAAALPLPELPLIDNVVPMPTKAPTTPPTMKLGEIKAALAPLDITAEGLRALGFESAGRQGASILFHHSDLPRILSACIAHLAKVRDQLAKAA